MTYHHHHQYLRRGAFVCNLNADNDDSSTSSTIRTASDDDNSSCSTSQHSHMSVAASSTSSHNPQDDINNERSGPTRTTMRKSIVRFDETLNKEYENTCMCREDCRFLWYSSKQLQTFQDSNFAQAQAIIQTEKAVSGPLSCKRLLRLTYQACCQANGDKNDDNETEEKDNEHGVLTSSQQEAVEFLLGHLALRGLGMERMIVRSNARDIQLRRKEMKRIIVQLQQQEMTTSSNPEDDKAEMIRSRCQALSRPARLYARHLAQAQAAYLVAMEKQQQEFDEALYQ